MGLGILEDHKLDHVPGTVFLQGKVEDVPGDESLDRAGPVTKIGKLYYDTSGDVPIVLVPQPSDDPNDPLNWSLRKRDMIMFILSVDAIIASAMSPIMSANSLVLLFEFNTTVTGVALLTGWHLFGVGVGGFIVVPTSRVWGKRHIFLIGTLLLVISNAWAGAATSYNSLLAARVIQGIAVAPFEALLGAAVGDLYHVHQRGVRMALANLSLYGGAFFSPVLAGVITADISWRWTFYFAAIFSGVMLPLVFFFCPETAYRRDPTLNTDYSSTDNLATSVASSPNLSEETQQEEENAAGPTRRTIPKKATFWQSLSPFNGRKTDDQLWLLALRPLPLFFQPAIAWGCLTMGTLIGWTVMIGVVIATIFFLPPFSFSAKETGYTYSGAFIGAILGFILCGLMADWSAKWLTRRNGGVYEPEFRILLVIPQLIVGCMGIYGFGITTEQPYIYNHGWIGPVIFLGLEVMGMTIGAVAAALYIVDAHRDIAIEAFTCLLMFKNLFSYGLTYMGYDWVAEIGEQKLFTILGSVQLVVCLTSIPMYILGKRNRSFFKRHDIYKILHIDLKTKTSDDTEADLQRQLAAA